MGVSIAVAVGLYGISFGALGVAAGLSVWQACALSALMFTGGSQFAFIGVMSGGGTLGAATLAASLLGVRNAVYGVQITALLRPSRTTRPLMAHLTIDESFATTMAADEEPERRRGFWTAGAGVWLTWNLFTFLGAWAGDSMGDPKAWGLDGAAVAAFLGLLWPRLRSKNAAGLAVLCALVTVLVVPFTPPGIPLLVAGVIAVLMHLISRGQSSKSTGTDHQSSAISGSIE